MVFDFSIFKNNENLLFVFIYFLVTAIAIAISIFIIVFIFKLVKTIFKKIFQKNEDLKYSKDFEPVVSEIEESRQERQKIAEDQQEFGKASTHGPKMQYMNIEKSSKDNETEKDQKKSFDEKEKKDIEEGLSALKKSGKKGEQEEEKSIFSRIKIPRAKRVVGGDSLGGAKSDIEKTEKDQKKSFDEKEKKIDEKIGATKEENDVNKKSGDYQSVSIGKTSVIQNNRLEILKGAEIKIPQAMGAEGFSGNKEPILDDKNFFSEIHNKIGKIESKTPIDSSIFGGKSEVSRIELRRKLRKDPKIWMAEKQVGLTLNPIERVKLEKEVFSQVYGRNISKSDLRWGIKKLNQKMLGTKNLAEKGKIRKEIKLFKKIGGVK